MNAGLEEQVGILQERLPVFTRSVKGAFRRFKTGVLLLGYALFFLLPWLPWSRPDAPSQAILFDLPGRRFLIFNLTVYPQDVVWLALLLFIAATALFFATALVGRAFCGYFCFQTLWTDFFIWVEAKIQGERPARIRLYRQPWGLEKQGREKLLKIGTTHLIWLLASFWTGFSFIAYFAYAPDLLVRFVSGEAATAAYITVAVLTLGTYFAAGLMREQICTYICPYGRFQSVMYDNETLAVHYDASRGEGLRGRASARAKMRMREERDAKGNGDCIDCGLCVQVCPTGIDIREGLQYKCISCGLCIDACNGMMDSMGFPRGLIRYDSEANLSAAVLAKPRLHWKRLKVVGYGLSIVLMSGYLVYSVVMRSHYENAVAQIRQPLFVQLSNGDIRNRYQIRITNKLDSAERYVISATGIPASALDLGNFNEVEIKPGRSVTILASVILSPEQAVKTHGVTFVITPKSAPAQAHSDVAGFYYLPPKY